MRNLQEIIVSGRTGESSVTVSAYVAMSGKRIELIMMDDWAPISDLWFSDVYSAYVCIPGMGIAGEASITQFSENRFGASAALEFLSADILASA